MNDKEFELDSLLSELAAAYGRAVPPRDGLAKLKRRMQAETNTLSEADLEWLAAAGEVYRNELAKSGDKPKD